jgi:hypothetical protein
MATTDANAAQLQEEERQLAAEIERRHRKSPAQLFAEREKRLIDAVELREPDRVPVTLGEGVFAARYAGIPVSAMYYDLAAYRRACRKTILDFEPDLCQGGVAGISGTTLGLLETRHQLWPGGNLPEDVPYQFIEGEYMKAEEYDVFLNDPTDFTLRYFLPRLFPVLAPISRLPPLRAFSGAGLTGIVHQFAGSEFQQLGQILSRAGEAQQRVREIAQGSGDEMNRLGFPTTPQGGGVGGSAFDVVADNLRGMRGAMLDMYRCPDKLLAACDKILQFRLAEGLPPDRKKMGTLRMASRPLHKGAEGFMSVKQFERFYWPTLKQAVLRDIELGYVPRLGWQGKLDSRLEYFLELPKGKVVCWLLETEKSIARLPLISTCLTATLGSLSTSGSGMNEPASLKSSMVSTGASGLTVAVAAVFGLYFAAANFTSASRSSAGYIKLMNLSLFMTSQFWIDFSSSLTLSSCMGSAATICFSSSAMRFRAPAIVAL